MQVLERINKGNNTGDENDHIVTLMKTFDLYSTISRHETELTELKNTVANQSNIIANQSNTITAMQTFIKEKFSDAPF